MLRRKNIKKIFSAELKVAFGIFLLVLLFQDFIKTNIKPSVMGYVGTHIEFLKMVILFVFIFCSSFLVLIVWLLEWGDRKKILGVTRYVSQLVCYNYYGDYRKTNVYRAIKTCLSKFSRDGVQQDDLENNPQGPGFTGRYVNPKGFASRVLFREESSMMSKEDTSDGEHRTFFKNGSVEKEVSYKNNMLDGVYRTYYEDGRLHQERHYKQGKLDGVYRAYDEEGIIYFDISYREGKQDGVMNTYYKTGILQYRDVYRNGKRINRQSFNESGELMFDQNESG